MSTGYDDYLSDRRRTLEDAFFLKEDKELIARYQAMSQMKETLQALEKTSGITNEVVLKKLLELEVRPETVASLALIPLVEVAWADGKVDERERQAVLAAARKSGFAVQDVDYQLLERWLTHRPDYKLLQAWTHYVQGLCEKLDKSERDLFKKNLLGRAQSVAEAAGGFLGLGPKVSVDEQRVLKKLEEAFHK